MKILLLDQGRQTLPFLKALANAGHRVIIVCNNRINEGYFSRYPVKKLIWPNYNTDPDGFKNHLLSFLDENDIDVTLCLGDISAEIVSKNRDEISRYTNVTIPEYSKFSSVTDKLQLMEYCMQNDIPCPVTYKLDRDFKPELLNKFKFPVIIKPRKGIGAMGVVKVENPEKVAEVASGLFDKYGPLLIQEYIPQKDGMQYQAQAFLNHEGHLKVCMVIEKPRFFPVNGGTSTANVTIENPEIVSTCKNLLEGIGWAGAADVDLILDPRDGVAKVLEINPRVTAGIKIGFAAGIDYADLHVRYALGEEIPVIKKYKVGVYSRNIFMDVMWFIFADSEMRKHTHPPFFKFFGKDVLDQTLSLDDPLTGLGFFLNMARKYTKLSYLREKIGNEVKGL